MSINDGFFILKCRLAKQFSCTYKKYHCLSGARQPHGNKSSKPVIRPVREAHPDVVCRENGEKVENRFS